MAGAGVRGRVVLQDAHRVGGPGKPGGLIGEVGQGNGSQVPVSGLMGGVDGGLPMSLGRGVQAVVEPQPPGEMRKVSSDGVEPYARPRCSCPGR